MSYPHSTDITLACPSCGHDIEVEYTPAQDFSPDGVTPPDDAEIGKIKGCNCHESIHVNDGSYIEALLKLCED